MSSGCPDLRAVGAALLLGASLAHAEAPDALRVCADPDHRPYSHRDGSGFENRIAALIADELGVELVTAWTPLQRGFVRKTVGRGLCDVLMGVPARFERVLTTVPLYRATYVVVQRPDAPPLSFDDPGLPRLRIGLQLPGGDFSATAPGHALAVRGALDGVEGFPVIGVEPAEQRMVEAVAAGRLDAAILWGPPAGWWAERAPVPLAVRPLRLPAATGAPPAAFSIAIGVARARPDLVPVLNDAIARRRADIDAILAAYRVPRLDASEASR